MDHISANPLDANSWLSITYTNTYDKLVYDNVNDIYYGINCTYSDGLSVEIYKITSDSETLLATTTYDNTAFDAYSDSATYIDAAYSTYLSAIVLAFYSEYYTDYEAETGYTYLVKFDPNTLTFDQFKTLDVTGDEIGVYYEYGEKLQSTDKYRFDNIFISDNYLIACAIYPSCCVFIYDLSSTGTNIDPVNRYQFRYDVSEYIYSSDYEYIRDEYIVSDINLSVSESNDFIVIAVGVYFNENSLDNYNYIEHGGYLSEYTDVLCFNKGSKNIYCTDTSLNLNDRGYASNGSSNYSDNVCVSCMDYDNNVFLITTGYDEDGGQEVLEYSIDSSGSSASTLSSCYLWYEPASIRIMTINDTLYTLAFYNGNLFIVEGAVNIPSLDASGIEGYFTTCVLSTSIPSEVYNQILSTHDSFIFKANYNSTLKKYNYYGFAGTPTLPLIDEEGMNAFIKVKN